MGFLSQLDGFDASSLNLLQRVLLVTDGTLTDVLEAAFLERIVLVKLANRIAPSEARMDELELDAGQPVMQRAILLQGEKSRRNFVYAESQLVVDRLHPRFRDSLIGSTEPIGRLWSELKIETWKQIREVYRRPAGELSRHFPSLGEKDLLARRYCVFTRGLPTIMTIEYFPERYEA